MALVGLGLRAAHFDAVLRDKPKLSCFEVLADNYLHSDSPALQQLSRIRTDYDFIAHGVGLSIGSADTLNFSYLQRVREFLERFDIQNYSDHLCFVSVDGCYAPELLPLALNNASLEYVIARVERVQDFLARPLILENISQYLLPAASSMTDLDFLNQLCAHTGARILLDVNNLWVNAHNHGASVAETLSMLDGRHVAYLHLGGYEQFEQVPDLMIDTHGAPVHAAVWDMYAEVVRMLGPRLTIIERDNHIPEFDVLLQEVHHAEKIQNELSLAERPLSIASMNFNTGVLTCDAPLELKAQQQDFFKALSGDASAAMGVYQSSIYANLASTLKKIYRPLNALLGEACFDALAQAFVRQSWPHDPVMDLYGQDLADFVAEHALSLELPYLADYVTYLSLLHSRFLLAPNPEHSHDLPLEHPETLNIFLAEHLALLQSQYPLDLIHAACLQKTDVPVHMELDDYYFCLVKQSSGVMRYSLSVSQYALLTLLSKFSNFMLVCEHYLEAYIPETFISDIEFLARHQLISIKEAV